MNCPKCNSENITVQIVTETKLKNNNKGCMYWLLIGWWLEFLLWFFLTVPRLLIAIFVPKNQKLVTKEKNMAVCQNCGHSWNIN